MGKITVKHYLNKRLKPTYYNEQIQYPVYVRVTYERKNHKIKSEWIVHPLSEKEFTTDKSKLNLMEYEKNIITKIIENDKDKSNIDVSSRLYISTLEISECYLGWVIIPKEVVNDVIKYVASKTSLSKSIFSRYVQVDYLSSDNWLELSQKKVLSKDLTYKAIYFALLLEFQSKYYPNNTNEYFAGSVLNYYEWSSNNAENRFIEYLRSKNALEKSEIENITKEFNKHLKSWSSMDCWRSKTSI